MPDYFCPLCQPKACTHGTLAQEVWCATNPLRGKDRMTTAAENIFLMSLAVDVEAAILQAPQTERYQCLA
jgi:hypothetical protein